MRTVIAYGTTEGQTERIAEVVADVLRARQHEVKVVDARDAVLAGYDAVVLGASVHMGRHDKHVVELARKNLDVLAAVPSAFFSVSLAAHGDTAEVERYVAEFQEQSGWRPDRIGVFSGALLYTRYGFVKRHMMKRIAADKPGGLDTDTSRDHVYTEWDGVRQFAEDFARSAEG